MAISFGTSGSGFNNGTSCTMSLSGATAGQFCAVIASFFGGGSITWPSGWNSQQGTPAGITTTVGYKVLTSADISSGLTLSSGSSGQIQMSFTSYNGTSPQEDNIGFNSPASSPSGSASAAASNSTDWVIALGITSDGYTISWSGTASLTQRVSGYSGVFETSIADSTAAVSAGTYTQTATSGGTGTGSPTIYSVAVITISDASAPSAPTLTSPTNASYENLSSGLSFTATYNSTDGQNQNAYAMEIKTSGAGSYSYWNGTALQGSIVWLSDSVAPGGSFGATLPSSVISNGNTYNWSMASQEAGGNLQGSFAAPYTFTGQGAPTVSVTAPTGTVLTPEPTVTWTTTPGTGASQTAYRVVIYTAAQQSIGGFTPGSSPSYWDSGTLAGSNSSIVVGLALTNQTTFYAYVQVTQTGGQTSAWANTSFTVSFDPCSTPTITAAAGTDPATGCPMVALTVQGTDNLLTYVDASLEVGIGSWGTGATLNCTPTQSSAHAKDGAYSLLMTPNSAGNMSVTTSVSNFYPVSASFAYTVQAAFWAGTTSRSCTVAINWYTAGGSFISTSTSSAVSDSTSAWTIATENVTSPSNAAKATVTVAVASASGTSDVHYVDCIGLQPWWSVSWARGGLVGTTNVAIQRSDGYYVRYASLANPADFPDTVSLVDSSANSAALISQTGVTPGASPTGPAFSQAAYVTTAGGYLQSAIGAGAQLGAITGSAYTFECRYTVPSLPPQGSYYIVASRYGAGGAVEWQLFISPGGTVTAEMWDSGGFPHQVNSSSGLTANTTHALAWVWTGSTLYLFIDGVSAGSTSVSSAITPWSVTALALHGYTNAFLWPSPVGAVIDEVRISNIARYTSGYTPATTPFTADGNTNLLFHLDAVESNETVTVYDYEAVPTVSYTYTAVVYSPTNYIMSSPATSSLVVLNTTQWWEFIPSPASGTGTATATSNSTQVQAQVIDWNPLQTEQSTAHPVAGQTTMNIVASTMMNQDFSGTFETFTVPTYQGLNVLMQGQQTVFISSPWGPIDTGYYRIGPSSGGLSTGVGNQTKNTKLMPSTSNAPHRTAQFTAVSQPRPQV